jgi:hypothetical protein
VKYEPIIWIGAEERSISQNQKKLLYLNLKAQVRELCPLENVHFWIWYNFYEWYSKNFKFYTHW